VTVTLPQVSGEPFSDEELAAWHGMLSLYGRIMRDLDSELIASHGISVREFDVLITLFNAPDRRLRMSGLAQSVMLSPSGLTRLIDRLERAQLVRRHEDDTDARSVQVALTDAGLARLDEARTTHNAVIRAHFTRHLRAEEMRYLGDIWQRVLKGEVHVGQ
jgi:DNA-binding MarR family transcriptional regulator